jgi:hypothetical protein
MVGKRLKKKKKINRKLIIHLIIATIGYCFFVPLWWLDYIMDGTYTWETILKNPFVHIVYVLLMLAATCGEIYTEKRRLEKEEEKNKNKV